MAGLSDGFVLRKLLKVFMRDFKTLEACSTKILKFHLGYIDTNVLRTFII